MRLLLIEDDKKIALFVSTGLREAGFAVDHTANGEDGLHLALSEPYDAAVIDLMLPVIDGLTIIKEMRDKEINTPVLILSAKRSVDERVEGLTAGGDDYLIKPFAFSELLARVQALVRRSTLAISPTELKVADLTLNIHTRKVHRAGMEIELQPLEFSLLEYLMRNVDRIVSKTMIMEHVWDYNFNPQTNVVEARICYLRDKVDKSFDKKLIHTVRGVGYVLKENP
ncbi:MAG: response regulator transcription factor [Desulfobacterales bacterium]|nr:MAG: response regulator transcription factor [Desulfobacterales bacterium]